MIPILARLIKGYKNDTNEVLISSVRTLANICGKEPSAHLTHQTGVLPTIVGFCGSEKDELALEAIKCMGQYTAGSDELTNVAISVGFLDSIKTCMTGQNLRMRENACWCVSNVAAGTLEQNKALLDSGLLETIITVVTTDLQGKPRIEATWALTNLFNVLAPHSSYVKLMVEAGCIEAMVTAMPILPRNLQTITLGIIKFLLAREGEEREDIYRRFDGAGGVAQLHSLRDGRQTRTTIVGRTAYGLLKVFFADQSKRARV